MRTPDEDACELADLIAARALIDQWEAQRRHELEDGIDDWCWLVSIGIAPTGADGSP